ncbi:MAG: hypothetical protein GYB66_12850, partial [Chloroflexi bacterium]|nr:hypothetical protein [Chloroflexota bacterium]
MKKPKLTLETGQALVEYVLILTLAFLGLVAILLLTQDAIANVWTDTFNSLIGQDVTPRPDALSESEFWDLVTAVASFTPESAGLKTNTPLPPTDAPTDVPTFTHTPETPTP